MGKTWFVAAALLLACGDDDGSTLELDERRFTLQSGYQAVEGTTPTLTFDEGMVGYFGGCNAKSGPFEIEGGKLVTGEITSDAAFCEAVDAQDAFFGEFLLADPQIELDGNTLTLTGSGATLVFIERP